MDDDGNKMDTTTMSDGRYDHLGHIPDFSLPTDSYVWVQIPFWKVIESPIRTNPEDYIVTCQYVNSKGKVTTRDCKTKLEIFIDQDDVMTIYPLNGWTGQAQVTLQAVNFNGEKDYTIFNVLVVESDQQRDCSSGGKDKEFWNRKEKCYDAPEVHLKFDKRQRFYL